MTSIEALFDIAEAHGTHSDRKTWDFSEAFGERMLSRRLPSADELRRMKPGSQQRLDAQERLLAAGFRPEDLLPPTCGEAIDDLEAAQIDPRPEVIEGILHEQGKMLISASSKAGKTYLCLNLAYCVVFGLRFLGEYRVAQGRVLFVNPELSEGAFRRRMDATRRALGLPPLLGNRFTSLPVKSKSPGEVFTDIRRHVAAGFVEGNPYTMIILDSSYKLMTGDENSARDVRALVGKFDEFAMLGPAVVYSHHHPKGAAGHKHAQDRASGSGVFARDYDALLDMTAIDCADLVSARQAVFEREGGALVRRYAPWIEGDDLDTMLRGCVPEVQAGTFAEQEQMLSELNALRVTICGNERFEGSTAFEVSFDLREFQRPRPRKMWFVAPLHREAGPELDRSYVEGFSPTTVGQRAAKRNDDAAALEEAFERLQVDGVARTADLADALGVSDDTVRRIVRRAPSLQARSASEGGGIERVAPEE